jgi:Uma2 family endonuclease
LPPRPWIVSRPQARDPGNDAALRARYTRCMVQSATPHGYTSVEEYLELEKTSSIKHEYVAGEIHAMVGDSRRHNRIAGKIYRMLADVAEGGACRVYISDMKLRVADDLFYYPDVMVVRTPDDPYTEDEPCLVVEVASPNTETTDRREKLAAYKKMSSLRTYLIVAQDRPWVERHWRGKDGVWRRADLADEGSTILIPCEKLAGMFRSPSSRGGTTATAGRVRCPVRFG